MQILIYHVKLKNWYRLWTRLKDLSNYMVTTVDSFVKLPLAVVLVCLASCLLIIFNRYCVVTVCANHEPEVPLMEYATIWLKSLGY